MARENWEQALKMKILLGTLEVNPGNKITEKILFLDVWTNYKIIFFELKYILTINESSN